jgi:hypothetical protein
LHYRVVGQYDYADEVEVTPAGAYVVHGGTYVTRGPERGRLAPEARRTLAEAVAALPPPDALPEAPPEATGFVATLTVDAAGADAAMYRWWAPEPPDDALARVVALLRRL